MCHNLDVKHIEKNSCDIILFTLLNDSSRSKDHFNACKDLKRVHCKPDLWPNDNGKFPRAVYTMSTSRKEIVLKYLEEHFCARLLCN